MKGVKKTITEFITSERTLFLRPTDNYSKTQAQARLSRQNLEPRKRRIYCSKSKGKIKNLFSSFKIFFYP